MPRVLLPALAVLALALPSAAQAKTKPAYYVSLGDSYAAGYQATGQGTGRTTATGSPTSSSTGPRRGYRLKLVNFGCGGETSDSILRRTKRCGGLGPGGEKYAGRTQAAAAARFLRRHRGEVKLVTVSIGGNDVTSCAASRTRSPASARRWSA